MSILLDALKKSEEQRQLELEAQRKREAQEKLQALRMERERKLEQERLQQQAEAEQIQPRDRPAVGRREHLLVAAISGLVFSVHLRNFAQDEAERVADSLEVERG